MEGPCIGCIVKVAASRLFFFFSPPVAKLEMRFGLQRPVQLNGNK